MNVDGYVSSGGLGGPAILPLSMAKMAQLTQAFPGQGVLRHRRHRRLRARAELLPARVRHGAGVHGGDARSRDRAERDQAAHRRACGEAMERHGWKTLEDFRGMPPRSRRRALADPPARRQGVSRRLRRARATRRADAPCRRVGASSMTPGRSTDFVELTEDLSGSPLWNPDLAPTPLARRTWSTYHIAALWIGMSVVITTYTLASGLMQQGMTWCAGDAHDPARQRDRAGADDPERARRHEVRRVVSRCCAAPASACAARTCRRSCARSSPAAGSASRRGSAALALNTLLVAAWPGVDRRARATSGSRSRCSGSSQVCDHRQRARRASRSSRAGRRRCCSAAARCCSGWAIAPRRRARVTSSASRRGCRRRTCRSGSCFPAALTANVGYWATLSLNIPDFTRYARSQRSQALGQALGPAGDDDGVCVHRRRGHERDDRDFRRGDLGSGRADRADRQPAVIIFGALIVLLAQLTTNMAANVVSPANDFSSLAPKRISYVTGGLITAAIGIVMMPWKLYADAAGVHLHLADRLFEPDGRDRRHPDRRLLGRPPAASCRCRICSSSTGATPTRDGVNSRADRRAGRRDPAGRAGLPARGDDAGRPGRRIRRSSTRSTPTRGS